MTGRLPIIDADGHVFEPFDMWTERLPAEFHERAWKRVRDDEGRERILFYGRATGLPYTVGTLCTPGGLAAGGRLDYDLDREVDRGVDDPARRVQLMDEQGIAVSVLFPTMTLGLDDIPDVDFRHAYARAYNSWIADFCRHDPVRLRWAAVVPLADPAWALTELARAATDGATTVMLSPIPTPGGQTLASPELEGFWGALEESGLPAVVHASDPGSPALGLRRLWTSRAQWQMGVSFQLQLGVLYVLDGGVLERHPRLRIGFFEGDVGWLAHWIGRLEATYEKLALISPGPERPVLQQFQEQCVISGEPADRGLALTAELVGSDRVLWASDWPHLDGAWPDPIVILRDREDLDDEQKRDIFFRGSARFYGIDLGELDRGWDPAADVPAVGGLLRRPGSRPAGDGAAAAVPCP